MSEHTLAHYLTQKQLTTALVSFVQLFGSLPGVRICGTVFANTESRGLKEFTPGAPFDFRHYVAVIWVLPPETQKGVIHAYVLVSPTQPISNKGRLNVLLL
jgi:hypothetical protein